MARAIESRSSAPREPGRQIVRPLGELEPVEQRGGAAVRSRQNPRAVSEKSRFGRCSTTPIARLTATGPPDVPISDEARPPRTDAGRGPDRRDFRRRWGRAGRRLARPTSARARRARDDSTLPPARRPAIGPASRGPGPVQGEGCNLPAPRFGRSSAFGGQPRPARPFKMASAPASALGSPTSPRLGESPTHGKP